MKNKLFIGNTVLTVLLCLSIVVDLALSHKIQKQQQEVSELMSALHRQSDIVGVKVGGINVEDPDGHPVKLSFSQADVPTLIYVFRPTCGWCARNLPNLKAMQAASQSNGKFRIIGISLDTQGLKQYVQNEQLTFPIYGDISRSDQERLAMGATPQTLMITNGAVTHNWGGAYDGDLLKEIESTLGIKMPGMSSKPPGVA